MDSDTLKNIAMWVGFLGAPSAVIWPFLHDTHDHPDDCGRGGSCELKMFLHVVIAFGIAGYLLNKSGK